MVAASSIKSNICDSVIVIIFLSFISCIFANNLILFQIKHGDYIPVVPDYVSNINIMVFLGKTKNICKKIKFFLIFSG